MWYLILVLKRLRQEYGHRLQVILSNVGGDGERTMIGSRSPSATQ